MTFAENAALFQLLKFCLLIMATVLGLYLYYKLPFSQTIFFNNMIRICNSGTNILEFTKSYICYDCIYYRNLNNL